ncbi:MAG: TlpA family protein disulfide reductase [Ktedonobacterales bacterium]|nr:TlpA family protein disulfide reductase [Ktedonobacterales bacterium]
MEPMRARMRSWRPLSWRGLITGALTLLLVVVSLVTLVGRLQAANRALGRISSAPFGSVVGRPAPDFTLNTWAWWDGASRQADQTRRLAALKGHPIVLNFWASWCDACKQEAPTLQAAWQRYQPRGVVFLGVATEDVESESLAFLRTYKITYFNGADVTGTLTVTYAAASIPLTVFIDRQGKVTGTHAGVIDAATLDRAIQPLL